MSRVVGKAAARWLCLAIVVFTGYLVSAGMTWAGDSGGYRLGPGDKLNITVFEEKSLSGKYEVSDQGTVALPLIGQVEVGGKTISQAQTLIENKYRANYLVNPQVSVEVLNYRPFFILGEVKKPGSYPYISGLTVLNAVALAGGFTPRADEDDIVIKREGRADGKQKHVSENAVVWPGDVIRVGERFF